MVKKKSKLTKAERSTGRTATILKRCHRSNIKGGLTFVAKDSLNQTKFERS